MLNYNYSLGSSDLFAAIKAARQAKKMTQQALAQKVGLPQSHLSKIEAGKVNVSLESLIEIARCLELEVVLVPKEKVSAVVGVIQAQSDFGSILSEIGSKPAYTLDLEELPAFKTLQEVYKQE